MNKPFANMLIDTPTELNIGGGGKMYADLLPEQRAEADRIIGGSQTRDIYDALVLQSRAVNQINKVLGGIQSDDMSITVDPQTGASNWMIRPKNQQGSGDADLGTAEKELMVYQRKLNDAEGNPQYGFDYVRSVAATEA